MSALKGRTIARFGAAGAAMGWAPRPGATLSDSGQVEILEPIETVGVDSPAIRLAGGGFIKVTVEIAFDASLGHSWPQLRILDTLGNRIAPERDLRPGLNEALYFVPSWSDEIRLIVHAHRPEKGGRFQLTGVQVELIDADDHYRHLASTRRQPVIASLASIPARRPMLRDVVDSMIGQCDLVRVFLNGYPDVPDFLDHPRIQVRRSQDWDDKGDAGKFGWIGEPDPEGYRLILDDDLLFPADFASRMSAAVAAYDNNAILGCHGVLIAQPNDQYYDRKNRSTLHFQSPLAQDTTVHILGTNAACFHSSCVRVDWDYFMFRNMADIFLLRYSQDHGVPMIAVARDRDWVRQNRQFQTSDTIFHHSMTRSGGAMDTSLLQTALVRRMHPVTLQRTSRPKGSIVLLASEAARAGALVKSFAANAPKDCDWSVLVVAMTDDPALDEFIGGLMIEHELHRLIAPGASSGQRLGQALRLAASLDSDFGLVTGDWAEFLPAEWAAPAAALARGAPDSAVFLPGTTPAAAPAAAPAGVLVGRDLLRRADHADAGVEDAATAYRLWAERLAAAGPPPQGVDLAPLARAIRVVADWEPGRGAKAASARSGAPPRRGLGGAFERVVLLVTTEDGAAQALALRRLDRAGVEADRIIDLSPRHAALREDYAAYLQAPAAPPPEVRRIGNELEFFSDYDSQAARVAWLEAKTGRKAIDSFAEWVRLSAMAEVLQEGLKDQVDSLLVVSPDAVWHRNTDALAAKLIGSLAPDWLMLQLGARQASWDRRQVSWRLPGTLYHGHGAALGAFAVGIRFDLMPYLLELTLRRQLPYDLGPQSAAAAAFAPQCYVAFPNLAIQLPLSDADRGAAGAAVQAELDRLRWRPQDYDVRD